MIPLETYLTSLEKYYATKNISGGDKQYHTSIKHEAWKNLGKVSSKEFDGVILDFLNKWRCRLPYKAYNKKISETLRKVQELIKPLEGEKLVSCNLEDHAETIKEAFKILRYMKIGKKVFGPTAASKALHMSKPSLFVMNDNNIREEWGVNDSEEGYYLFLKECKEFAKKIPKEILTKYPDRTLSKLIDEGNYYHYTYKNRKKP